MEIICIEKRAWEMLKQQLGLLTTEVANLKAQFCPGQAERWLDQQEVCLALNISKRTLQIWRTKAIIPCSMIGGKYYYKESDVAEMLSQNMEPHIGDGAKPKSGNLKQQ